MMGWCWCWLLLNVTVFLFFNSRILFRFRTFVLTTACDLVFVIQSAKTNMNVEDVFFTIARDIKQRLAESDSKPEVSLIFRVK